MSVLDLLGFFVNLMIIFSSLIMENMDCSGSVPRNLQPVAYPGMLAGEGVAERGQGRWFPFPGNWGAKV